MTKPSPRTTTARTAQPIDGTLHGATEEWGPLVRQPARPRAWRHPPPQRPGSLDACVLTDSGQMWEEARAIASRILAPARRLNQTGRAPVGRALRIDSMN